MEQTRVEKLRAFREKQHLPTERPRKFELPVGLQGCADSGDWRGFIEEHSRIKRKGYGIVKWEFNRAQVEIYNLLKSRNFKKTIIVILKLRQETGMTTFVENIALLYAMLNPGRTVKSIAPTSLLATEQFEDIVKLSYEFYPDDCKLTNITDNKRKLAFPNHSSYRVLPATKEAGRGGTVDFLHLTEAAFYDNLQETWTAIDPSRSEQGVVIIESTANGYNMFRDWYCSARDNAEGFRDWEAFFFPVDYFFDENNVQDQQFLENKRKTLKEKYDQEYPSDDSSCFLGSGNPYFPAHNVKTMMDAVLDDQFPVQKMAFEITKDVTRIVEDEYGDCRCFKVPEPGHGYIVGVDVAEGKENSDNSVLSVIDRVTTELVFEYAGLVDETIIAHYADYIGWEYNNAILAVESNHVGHATMRLLEDTYNYPNMYYDTQQETLRENIASEPGIRVTSKTRMMILGVLYELIRNNELIIPFRETIDELMTFVRKATRPEAESSKKDDRVMALAHACYVHVNNPFVQRKLSKRIPKAGTIQEQNFLADKRAARNAQNTERWVS